MDKHDRQPLSALFPSWEYPRRLKSAPRLEFERQRDNGLRVERGIEVQIRERHRLCDIVPASKGHPERPPTQKTLRHTDRESVQLRPSSFPERRHSSRCQIESWGIE